MHANGKKLYTARVLLVLACSLILTCAWPCRVEAQGIAADKGTIEETTEDTIHVQGEKGFHVFELIGVCDWCEVGQDVVVLFEGLTRVRIRPDPNPFGKPAVQMFIQKDGRFGGF